MPLYHNNILSVTISELETCGLSSTYVRRAISGNRNGELYCWQSHKENNIAYVHYDTLKPVYKELIKQTLCAGVEPDLFITNQQAQKYEQQREQFFGNLTSQIEIKSEDVKILSERNLFTPQDVHRVARTAGWLRLWRTMDTKTARKNGFQSVTEVQQEMFKICLNEQSRNFVKFPKKITNERVLDRLARRFAQIGLDALVSGCFGNANQYNYGAPTHALLMELASKQTKLSFEDIGLLYNQIAEDKGLPKVPVCDIRKHLNKPIYKRVWNYARHGKLAADLEFQPEIIRLPVSRPDALWSIDGTPTQMYYRDANNKIKSDLYIYFVTDVYSSAIIGHSIAFSETGGMVAEALENAVDLHGYKPYQLQYDNSSANVSEAITGLMKNMSHVHFACKPYRGQSKYVESYIGHFQQRVLRQCEYFKGGNITTKSLNSKANPELLAKFKKNPEQLPTEQELLDILNAAVNEWNSRGEKRDKYGAFVGESKLERYQTEHADREKLTYIEKISLFMVEMPKEKPYKKQGIEITISGKKHNYIVPDGDGVGDFIFSQKNLNEEFKIRLNPTQPDFITLYKNGVFVATAHEKEMYSACIADLKRNGDGDKIKRFILKQEEYGYQYAMREMERQRQELERCELRATGTDGFGWWNLSKQTNNLKISIQEDVRNGITEQKEITPELRALLNM